MQINVQTLANPYKPNKQVLHYSIVHAVVRSIVWFSIRNPHIGIRHQMPNGFPTVYPATAFPLPQ